MTITQQRVKELFDYHQDGYLIWKNDRARRVKAGDKAGWNNGKYIKVTIDSKNYYLHRLIYCFFNGALPKCLDHKDGNPLNNKIENLREATQSQNLMNKAMQFNNKSGIKGLSWCNTYKKWRARISINGKNVMIGYFKDFDNAKTVLAEKRSELHKEFARFN